MTTVAVTLELIELDETPGLLTGEAFEIAVRFSDLLGDRAVFSGYVDVEFEPAQLRVDEILYDATFYPGGQTGAIDNDLGLVDEVGAVDGISPPPDEFVDRIVFRLRMTALVDLSEEVTTTIATNAPEASGSEIAIFGSDGDFRDDTDYGSLLLPFSDDSPFFTADSFSFELVTVEDPIGTATATDPNGDNLFFEILEGNDPDGNGVGAFAIDNNGQISVANADELIGTNPFELTVAVSDLESELPGNPDDTASVTIESSGNNPPTVTNEIADLVATESILFSFIVPEDTFTDIDPDDPLSLTATLANGNPLPNWLSFNPTTNTFSGTPTTADLGTLQIQVTATDTASASVSDTFNLSVVQDIDNPPTLVTPLGDRTTDEDVPFNLDISANFSDDEGDLDFSATGLPDSLNIDPNTGIISGTPTNEDVGIFTAIVTATDTAAQNISDTLELTIENVNDAPVAVNDSFITDRDTILEIDAANGVLANDTDPDAEDSLTVRAVAENTDNLETEISLPSGALLTLNADGSYQYNPNGQFADLDRGDIATDSFTYTISDENNATDVAEVFITINSTFDPMGGDLVFGTRNNDTLNAADRDNPYAGDNQIVFTGEGEDIIDGTGAAGNNRLYSGSDNDLIFAIQGDRVFTSDGDDEVFATTNSLVFAGNGNDRLDASQGSGSNRLYAQAGDDNLFAGNNDVLFGGEGIDRLFVGAGGDNLLTGGAGDDQFWIATSEQVPNSANTITDFISGEDVIGIGGFPVLTFNDLSITQDGANAIIGLDGNTPLAELQGIQADRLGESDFTFAAQAPV